MYTEEQIQGMLTNPERILLYRIWQEFQRHNELLEKILQRNQAGEASDEDKPKTKRARGA